MIGSKASLWIEGPLLWLCLFVVVPSIAFAIGYYAWMAIGKGYAGQKLVRRLCCITRSHGVKRSVFALVFARPLSEFTNSFSRPDLQRISLDSYAFAALGKKNVRLQRKWKRCGSDACYE